MRALPVTPILAAGIALALAAGLSLTACKKAPAPKTDPHSAEGVMRKLTLQVKLLNDAVARQDFKYVHDYTYYLHGLVDAFASKLNESEKQKVSALFDELKTLTDQLDLSSGRKHLEATQNSMNRLTAVMDQLSKEFQEMKRSDPALTRQALLNSPAGATTR